jgi:hypothetical protein
MMLFVGSKFVHMGPAAHLEVKPEQRPDKALVIQLVWISFQITKSLVFRRSGPLLNPRLCPRIMPTIGSSGISEDRSAIYSYVAKYSALSRIPFADHTDVTRSL